MLIDFERILHAGSVTASDRDKARVYAAISDSEDATRKRLAARLKMRPTSVSRLVKELIEDGVIRESERIDSDRQGRPEILLEACPQRFSVLVVHVVSHDIRCALVDMGGAVLGEKHARIADTLADKDTIVESIGALVDVMIETAPPETEILGIGIAVPGIVDPIRKRWVYTARWPAMRSLDFESLARRTGLAVRVDRNLNLELATRLMRKPEEREGGVLFIHWGYGIGSAYAWKGMVIESNVGSFGEFGHWAVSPHSDRQCHCGEKGCLEALAALWAMLPEIRERFPDAPADEGAFEIFMHENGLASLPAIRRAVDAFLPALVNLNKVFFADRIVLTGPFAADPAIFGHLEAGLRQHMPEYARDSGALYIARRGALDVTQGATLPFFEDRLRAIFMRHD